MEETLTVTRLGVKGPLKRTLQSTNPCESMIEWRPPIQPQRQALAVRRDVPALDSRRDARGRATVPTDHWLRRPRQARARRRSRDHPAHHHTSPRKPLRSSPSERFTLGRQRSYTPAGTSSVVGDVHAVRKIYNGVAGGHWVATGCTPNRPDPAWLGAPRGPRLLTGWGSATLGRTAGRQFGRGIFDEPRASVEVGSLEEFDLRK
jgi:hypothetical protein